MYIKKQKTYLTLLAYLSNVTFMLQDIKKETTNV